MSDDFGDIDDDDVIGTEPADPEQVAIKLQEIRGRFVVGVLRWQALDDAEREANIEVVAELLAWLRRQGSNF